MEWCRFVFCVICDSYEFYFVNSWWNDIFVFFGEFFGFKVEDDVVVGFVEVEVEEVDFVVFFS